MTIALVAPARRTRATSSSVKRLMPRWSPNPAQAGMEDLARLALSRAAGNRGRGCSHRRHRPSSCVDLVKGRVDVDHELLVARARPEEPRRAKRLADELFELTDVSEGERRKKVPSVEGAITRWPSTFAVEPARSMSAWSMWEAEAAHGVHQGQDLPPRFEAPDPSRQVNRRVPQVLEAQTSRQLSPPTDNSPALATRFGSSKVTANQSRHRDTELTESASCS